MKKFQLEPTTNIALINVILDKCISLGYTIYGNRRENFNNPKNWIGNVNVGQYIFCDENGVTRDSEPINEYETLSLDQFFKLKPEDCGKKYTVQITDIKFAVLTKEYLYIPFTASISPSRAIELAKKILEVMQ